MSIRSGLSTNDVQAFKIFTKLFIQNDSDQTNKISIILTFSQRVTFDQYQLYIIQFEQIPELQIIYQNSWRKNIFYGSCRNGNCF